LVRIILKLAITNDLFTIYHIYVIETFFSFPYCLVSGMPARPEDSAHVTAIYGDWVALNCDVNFPDGHVVPYVVQWWRKVCF
jgi:hypothetical protein